MCPPLYLTANAPCAHQFGCDPQTESFRPLPDEHQRVPLAVLHHTNVSIQVHRLRPASRTGEEGKGQLPLQQQQAQAIKRVLYSGGALHGERGGGLDAGTKLGKLDAVCYALLL
eukprot:CAMPEP_0202894048 /NCGR_PEP_ID=MMETSP1392-20130828/3508_1 /ASSEMBLY_ACC=CAM_ASM_000868 /TAXON_ID=225041 /ORGANISM="Chlamydomonas chlamydogama, Strain SAG 11-48b" /LENGTH=113 /DNA_ID=CAMNT_0049578597 /DNA_START=232 /DNA_END=573 /DNA_ORIENTATION=+